MRPQVAEINCSTGEVELREMNDAEYSQHLLDIEQNNILNTESLGE